MDDLRLRPESVAGVEILPDEVDPKIVKGGY